MKDLLKSSLVILILTLVVVGCSFRRDKHRPSVPAVPMDPPSAGLTKGKNPISVTFEHPYSSLTRVTFSESGQDFDPNISKDGKYIYFASTMHSHKPDIYRKKIYSKVVEKITFDNAYDINPSISPDGKRLAFASNRNGKFQIFLKSVNARSVNPQQLTRGDHEERNPSWSPDGKKIIFNRRSQTTGKWHICERTINTNEEITIRIFGLYPKYSPDGKHVVCQTYRNRDMPWYSIWSYTFSGEIISEILENAQWGAVTPCYSTDGGYIVFGAISKSFPAKKEQRYDRGDDVWVIGSDGNNLIRLTNHQAPDWHPVWGPKNSVFFISLRNGHQNIWMVKPQLPSNMMVKLDEKDK
ncbi:MAG: hypothetical protein COA79_15030 [Planctomycetota bacterium]|nr:MAG: hypothetical protein COA79_15030 [Planctomycetota bacterium]